MSEIPHSLATRLQAGAIPVGETLRYAIGMAEALREVHSRGRPHGFLQPEGIAVSEGQVRLLPSSPSGVSPYFSPEQVTGKALTPRTDIFSLGALMYEMLSWRPAFSAPTKPALRLEILDRQPPLLENVPLPLARLVQRCLEKKPERRIQRIEILLAELKLQAIMAREPAAATSEPQTAAREPQAEPVPSPVLAETAALTPVPDPAPAAVSPPQPKKQPACPVCGSRDVHDSRPQGPFEAALLRIHVSINRCYRCYYRFLYAAGLSIRKPGSPAAWLRPIPKTTSSQRTAHQ